MPWVGGDDRSAGTWVDDYKDPGSYEPNAMQGYWSAVEAANGLPYGYMRSMAGIESQGGQNLTSATGAVGPFQFTGTAANQVNVPKAATIDPFVGAAAAGSLANYNRDQYVRRFGSEPSGFELYMMHQLGAGGAMAALNADPSTPIYNVPNSDNILTQGVRGISGNSPVGDFVDVFRKKYASFDPSTQASYTSSNLDPQGGGYSYGSGLGSTFDSINQMMPGIGGAANWGTPQQQASLEFTVGGPSGGGGQHWDPGDGRSPGGWVPDAAPSAASLNGFSSGGPTGNDWAANYGGGMTAADAASQWAGYQGLQSTYAQDTLNNSNQLSALQASYGPTTTFQDNSINGYTYQPGIAVTNWGAPTAQSQFNQNIASMNMNTNYPAYQQYSFL